MASTFCFFLWVIVQTNLFVHLLSISFGPTLPLLRATCINFVYLKKSPSNWNQNVDCEKTAYWLVYKERNQYTYLQYIGPLAMHFKKYYCPKFLIEKSIHFPILVGRKEISIFLISYNPSDIIQIGIGIRNQFVKKY